MSNTTTEPVSLVPATMAVVQTAPAAHAANVKDIVKAHRLFEGSACRKAISYVDSARLWSSGLAFTYAGELYELNQAAVKRFLEVQQETLDEWAAWGRQRARIGGANTMSKLVEQEMNLAGLIGQIFTDYLTNLVELQENIEVGYAYWLSKKLGPLSLSRVPVAT